MQAQVAPGRCPPLALEDSFVTADSGYEILTRSVDHYQELNKVGEGTYGSVFKARERDSGNIFALKKISVRDEASSREGVTVTTLREIVHLFRVRHDHVVHLREVALGGASARGCDSMYLVLEYLAHDLPGVQQRLAHSARRSKHFPLGDAKTYMKHLLRGLAAMHRRGLLHRDLKSANLLVSRSGVLKIADFGLSRDIAPGSGGGAGGGAATGPAQLLTPRVCTLWYRAPELLLGGTARMEYDYAVDIWSAGCILYELLAGTPLVRADDEVAALGAITDILGSPDPTAPPGDARHWPEVARLPGWESCARGKRGAADVVEFLTSHILQRRKPLREAEAQAVRKGVEIAVGMLALRPAARPSAAQVYAKDWFHRGDGGEPVPTEPGLLACVAESETHVLDIEREKAGQSALRREQGPRRMNGPLSVGPSYVGVRGSGHEAGRGHDVGAAVPAHSAASRQTKRMLPAHVRRKLEQQESKRQRQ